jgi:flagellar biogenesis protein FliO
VNHSVATIIWQTAVPVSSSGSLAHMLLQTVVGLGLVCGLCYVAVRVIMPRLSSLRMRGGLVRVAFAMTLEPRKRLYVIEVAGQWMLLATSESGTQLISTLDSDAAAATAAALELGSPHLGTPTGLTTRNIWKFFHRGFSTAAHRRN